MRAFVISRKLVREWTLTSLVYPSPHILAVEIRTKNARASNVSNDYASKWILFRVGYTAVGRGFPPRGYWAGNRLGIPVRLTASFGVTFSKKPAVAREGSTFSSQLVIARSVSLLF
jgi:hypothetical protein